MPRLIIAVVEENHLNPTISKFQVHQVNGRHIKRWWKKHTNVLCVVVVILLLHFYLIFLPGAQGICSTSFPSFSHNRSMGYIGMRRNSWPTSPSKLPRLRIVSNQNLPLPSPDLNTMVGEPKFYKSQRSN